MDKLKVIIKRQKDDKSPSYVQTFEYTGDLHIPVTTLLERINNQERILDIDKKEVEPIKWSCSCLQGLCGSCALVINGWPKLVCKTFVDEEVMTKHFNKITIEPLGKFPVIKDLKVDRSHLYNSMKETQQWLVSDARINSENIQFEYEMSQCLMCGICLEACPNYNLDEKFVGVPVVVSSAKIIAIEEDEKHLKLMKNKYKNRFYNGCVKSMVCQDVCPMKIPTQEAISSMNRKSIWKIWQLYDKLNKSKIR